MDKLDKLTELEVAQKLGAEVPSLEVKQIRILISKFQFTGQLSEFNPQGYDKEALEALEKLKTLFDSLYNLGIKKD